MELHISYSDGASAHPSHPSVRGSSFRATRGKQGGQGNPQSPKTTCLPNETCSPGSCQGNVIPLTHAHRTVLCGKHKLFQLFPQNQLNVCFTCRFSVSP